MNALTRQLGSMLKLGTIGFGGGSAMIPVFERELVHNRALLDEDTFVRHTVIANVTPGGLPTKLAALSAGGQQDVYCVAPGCKRSQCATAQHGFVIGVSKERQNIHSTDNTIAQPPEVEYRIRNE